MSESDIDMVRAMQGIDEAHEYQWTPYTPEKWKELNK